MHVLHGSLHATHVRVRYYMYSPVPHEVTHELLTAKKYVSGLQLVQMFVWFWQVAQFPRHGEQARSTPVYPVWQVVTHDVPSKK